MRSQMVTFPTLGDVVVVTTLRSLRLVFPTTYKQRGNKVRASLELGFQARFRMQNCTARLVYDGSADYRPGIPSHSFDTKAQAKVIGLPAVVD